jgi:hypothetical protein
VSARIAIPAAVAAGLLCAFVMLGGCTLILLFAVVRGAEQVAAKQGDVRAGACRHPAALSRALYAGRRAFRARLGGPCRHRPRGMRSRPRSGSVMHRRGPTQLSRRRGAGTVPRLDVAALRDQCDRGRSARYVERSRRHSEHGELPSRVRRARELSTGDICLQPCLVVRRRGARVGSDLHGPLRFAAAIILSSEHG